MPWTQDDQQIILQQNDKITYSLKPAQKHKRVGSWYNRPTGRSCTLWDQTKATRRSGYNAKVTQQYNYITYPLEKNQTMRHLALSLQLHYNTAYTLNEVIRGLVFIFTPHGNMTYHLMIKWCHNQHIISGSYKMTYCLKKDHINY